MNWLLILQFILVTLLLPDIYQERETLKLPLRTSTTEPVFYQEISSSDQNYLPPSFYSNYPQSGGIEVGGYAGGTASRKIPGLGFHSTYGINLQFTIVFEENPLEFETSSSPLYLGFSLTVLLKDQNRVEKNGQFLKKSLKDIFYWDGKSEITDSQVDYNEIFTSQYVIPNKNVIALSFVLPQGAIIESFQYIYSRKPKPLKNVILSAHIGDIERVIEKEFVGDYDIYQDDYIDPRKKETIHLNSQYGSCYSLDYLKHKFPFMEQDSKKSYYFDQFDDRNEYFVKGDTGSLGTIFSIVCYHSKSDKVLENLTFTFEIVDYIGPNITLLDQEEITASYTEDINSEEFLLKHFIIEDNLDQEVKTEIRLIGGKEIPLNTIGKFSCEIIASDQSNNRQKENFILNVIDDVPPIIYADANEIFVSTTKPVNDSYLLSLFYIEDEIDGHIEANIIENTYRNNETTIGSYQFTIQGIDHSGNESRKTIVVTVGNETSPQYAVKECHFTVLQGNVPSIDEVIASLIDQQVLQDKRYRNYQIIEGEELNDDLKVGIHKMTLRIEDEEGEIINIQLTVEVLKNENVRKEPLWQMIVNFFINLWNKIVSFFTRR